MFDFANSSYTTVIITAIYSAFFVAKIAGGNTKGDYLWAVTLTISYALVVITSPIIGSIADIKGWHKKILTLSYSTCVIFTALLFFVKTGDVFIAMILLIVSNWAFALSENLISSFLPRLADKKNIGKISGYGWALGYIGGLFSLLICLIVLENTKENGHYSELMVRSTTLITAAFFLVAGLPTIIWVKQRRKAQTIKANEHYIISGFKQIFYTLKNIRKYSEMFKFMLSYLFYSSGIATVISFAAIYGQGELGFNAGQTILLIVVVNITSAIGAFLFGFFQDKTSAKTTLILTIFIWLVTIVWVFLAKTQIQFWLAANLAGIAIGASQSSGRALVGLFSPVDKQAEFYGIWGLFGKLAAIAGIYSYGLLVITTGSRRIAVVSTVIFFLIGFIILLFVDEKKGIETANTQ